jgi:SUMO ligase MMS21 Smc5/6 complex component
MEKRKFTIMVTPNTLEIMIEYTIISNILDRICEMTTKPLEYPRDPT